MGFLDNLFKPKYKNSNWEVRLEAVKELTDENILIDIAYNDETSSIRHEAVKKITNQEVLIDILKTDNDKWVCMEAVEKITDVNVLSEIAETHYNDDVRLKAAVKSNNEKVLEELLLKYEDVTYTINKEYLEVLKRIDDEETLIKIAKHAKNKRFRQEAINKINNQDVLIDLAINDRNSEIREKATQRVEDKELLSEKIEEQKRIVKEREKYYNLDLAKNNQYHYNRESAIKKINDEELLEDIALNSQYSDSRSMATRKINNQERLLKLAKESDDEWVRKIAIEKINDQKILTELVQNEKDTNVRVEIIKKISNQKELLDIIRDTYHELDSLERRDFLRIINDEKILCSLAKEESDWAAAEHIACTINDEELLEYIALRHYSLGGTTYHQPNSAAIKRIKNKDILMKIYENTDDYENKMTVGEKLKEFGDVDDESLNEIKNKLKEESIENQIQQLRLDIAYADHNCSGDCIELAKLYEEKGNIADAKSYYERAIKEMDIIINSTSDDKQYWIDKKMDIEQHLKNL